MYGYIYVAQTSEVLGANPRVMPTGMCGYIDIYPVMEGYGCRTISIHNLLQHNEIQARDVVLHQRRTSFHAAGSGNEEVVICKGDPKSALHAMCVLAMCAYERLCLAQVVRQRKGARGVPVHERLCLVVGQRRGGRRGGGKKK